MATKIVTRYVVQFKRFTGREPIYMSILGGMAAEKLWADGAPNVRIKGTRYSCDEISSIGPVLEWGAFAERRLKAGTAITEEQLDAALAGKVPLVELEAMERKQLKGGNVL